MRKDDGKSIGKNYSYFLADGLDVSPGDPSKLLLVKGGAETC